MKNKFLHSKKLIIFIICTLIFVTLVTNCGLIPYSSKALGRYEHYRNKLDTASKANHASHVLPDFQDFSKEDVVFYEYRYMPFPPFMSRSESMILVLKYDLESYIQKLSDINKYYRFLEEPVLGKAGVLFPGEEFEINDYTFRVIADLFYPGDFGMIANSDEQQTIAYLYFYNFNLDEVESMTDFVHRYYSFRWE